MSDELINFLESRGFQKKDRMKGSNKARNKSIVDTYLEKTSAAEKEKEEKSKSSVDLKKNKYKDRLNFTEHFNMAVFKIFSDYFNIIYQEKKKQENDEVEMIGLVNEKFVDTISLYGYLGTKEVWFKFLGLTIKMGFSIYKSNGEIFYEISLTSSEKTYYKNTYVYKELFQRALRESELAGSYITMVPNVFQWEIRELEKRTMNDIYLPNPQMEDLKMFINVFSNNKELLRFLLVGVPGTGKTESCLTLMNELKNRGVTIIKTPICRYLNEKVNLAVLLKPSLLILDDLDLSLGSRNSGGYSEMLQTFLDILDGTDKLPKDVGILATTNSAFLLDLAAQRPGRFDKVMIFDELSKDNILKIILKSLKYKFNLTEKKDVEVFINPKIINKFHSSQVTGAHIYNSISMMKLKQDMIIKSGNRNFDITVNWLLDEIDAEIKILDKIKAQQKINDRLNNAGAERRIGFENEVDESREIIGNDYQRECPPDYDTQEEVVIRD